LWELYIARYQLAASLYHLGDHRGALLEARLNHRSGLETGDFMAAGISLDVWARAAPADLPQEVVDLEANRNQPDAQIRCQVSLAKAARLLAEQDTAGAIEVLDATIQTIKESGVRNPYTLPAYTWLVTARRLQAQLLHDHTPAQRRLELRRAARDARRAIRTAHICANDLPQALREYGIVQAMRGRTRHARRLLRRSSWWRDWSGGNAAGRERNARSLGPDRCCANSASAPADGTSRWSAGTSGARSPWPIATAPSSNPGDGSPPPWTKT
jgi:hypothetical protein